MRRLVLAVFLIPTVAHAQVLDIMSGLFDSVNSVAFNGRGGLFTSDGALQATGPGGTTQGLGVEVLLDLPSPEGVFLELGLGTHVMGSYEAREPSLDLRGSIRTLPHLAVYAAGFGLDTPAVTPYLGVGFGVAELWNTTGYAADGTAYAVESTAYELTASAGVAVQTRPFDGLFVQVDADWRRFEGLRWDGSPLPDGWPRSIDASTWSVAVGWQFRLTRPEPDAPPAEAGGIPPPRPD